MNPILKNVLAVIVGVFSGGILNMALIQLSPQIIPPPPGVDFTTMEGLKESMHLMGPQHFLMPFLAHALGTFVGAFAAVKIAVSYQMVFALVIGALNLSGGILNIIMLPSPLWFSLVDLIGAYLPMCYLGWRLARTVPKV
jgi:hypothetical protein